MADLSFQLEDVLRIEVINDDALGPGHWITFTMRDGSEQIFATATEREAAARWIAMNIPAASERLRRLLQAKPFEDYLIAELYESSG